MLGLIQYSFETDHSTRTTLRELALLGKVSIKQEKSGQNILFLKSKQNGFYLGEIQQNNIVTGTGELLHIPQPSNTQNEYAATSQLDLRSQLPSDFEYLGDFLADRRHGIG
jgi:MORN repeat